MKINTHYLEMDTPEDVEKALSIHHHGGMVAVNAQGKYFREYQERMDHAYTTGTRRRAQQLP